MHIYKVAGTVTLNRAHPSFQGSVLKLAEPFGETLIGEALAEPDAIVVWDELGAALGSIIAVADGAEAAQPFRPNLKPVDAYNSAILDEININNHLLKD
ncbi:MAG: carbon dioxide concentrating mechanism protein CcmL [Planctomycetaceae bacterium]|jgi:ethanolamine utilization protein EutN|nr:carbon dioxide concentrating mechanism protein CcmL [Planctomycetaceae bacterium]